MHTDLLDEIREFLTATGMSASYFGKAATGDSTIVNRLEIGGSVSLITADRLHAFMDARRAGEKPRHKPVKGRIGRPRRQMPVEASR